MLARSFFIKSSGKLLVTRTGVKAQLSSILGRIRPFILELLALEWRKFHRFELEYLWSQLANLDQILCVASLGWGKGCIRFWGRLTLAHWTQVSDRCPFGYLFLFCYERDFMTSLSDVKQAAIIEAFKSTSRYLDDLLTIDNPYFEGMVNRIYPPELQLNKANTSDTEAPFLDLHLSISNGFVSSKIYDKRDAFDFDIVNFPFFGWWRSPFYLLQCLHFSTYSVC